MNLHIFNKFERIGLIDNYESFFIERHYDKVGSFQLTVNNEVENAHLLLPDIVLLVDGRKDKAVKIENFEIDLDEEGREIKTVTGRTLGAVLEYRNILPDGEFDKAEGSVESVIHYYVNKHIINSHNTKRNIPFLMAAENLNRGDIIRWQSRHKSLREEIENISNLYDLGWSMDFDYNLNKWIFKVNQGKNLSINQSVNRPVVFAPKYDNIKMMRYVKNTTDYKNVGYCYGVAVESERLFEVGDADGYDRKEIFFAVSTNDENYINVHDLSSRQLKEHILLDTLEGQIFSNDMFKYEVDFNLGDIVTIENKKWGIQSDKRIMSIREVYEDKGLEIQATFGTKIPSIVDRLKREFRVFEPYKYK